MALLIWGNSLVPGSGSGSLSLTVMEAIRGFLRGVGLPYEWVTNFVVRKCAHFTEYLVLGILATHAFDFEGRRTFDVLLPTAVFLLLIPSIDETIQLFVPGRAGMITDVMIDCCGAAVPSRFFRKLIEAASAPPCSSPPPSCSARPSPPASTCPGTSSCPIRAPRCTSASPSPASGPSCRPGRSLRLSSSA